MENREHFQEINALVASIAKALGQDDKQVATGLESGAITLSLGEDENGNRYIEARCGDQTGKVYQGAIRYADGVEPPTEPEEPTAG